MNNTGKWSKAYWRDLGERAGASLVGGLLTMVTLTSLTDLTWAYGWAVLGVPTATSVLKGLLVNLGGDVPSASIVDVSSTTSGVLRDVRTALTHPEASEEQKASGARGALAAGMGRAWTYPDMPQTNPTQEGPQQ